jgi:tryptophan-rich sensory protein
MLSWIYLIPCILLPVLGGFIMSLFTRDSMKDWFKTVKKPTWNPPSWLFGPVWTSLYIMMGIASWIILGSADSTLKTYAIALYIAQLLLNFAWSPVFFYFHQIFMALCVILVLWVLILLTTIIFSMINGFAGILFVPYLLWVTFASALNAKIWMLN